MKNVFVTGASGTVGSEIVRQLVAAGAHVKAGTRKLEAYNGPAGVEPVAFAYENRESFETALAGVDAVVLIAPPLDTGAFERMLPFVEAVTGAGLQTVLISAFGIEYAPESSLGKMEAYLTAWGGRYTFLRPTFFMENFSTGFLSHAFRFGGVFLNAGDGATTFISVEDIAHLATAAIVEGGHDGKAYGLTTDESLNHQQVIDKINAAAGTHYIYQALSDEAMKGNLLQAGLPESSAQQATDMFGAVAKGLWNTKATGVAEVLGRPATSFDDFVAKNVAVWQK